MAQHTEPPVTTGPRTNRQEATPPHQAPRARQAANRQPNRNTQPASTVQRLERWFNKNLKPSLDPIVKEIDKTKIGKFTTDTLARFGAAELTFLFDSHVAADTVGALFVGSAVFATTLNPVLSVAAGVASGKKAGELIRGMTEPNSRDLRESGVAKMVRAFKTGKIEEPQPVHRLDEHYNMLHRIGAVTMAMFTDRRVTRATSSIFFLGFLGLVVGGPAFAPVAAGVGAVIYNDGHPFRTDRLSDVADTLAEIWKDPSRRQRGIFQRTGRNPVPVLA